MIDITKLFNGKEEIMKKFIQILLVVVLIFALFQAVTGRSLISSGMSDSNANSSALSTSAEDVQIAAECLVRVKGVICVRPNVGWNS
jgi:hypothetical protein